MDTMFWIWLGVIVGTILIEIFTMELVSIWFTFGAIIPFILSACNVVSWEIQIVIFVVISSILIILLRTLTKKFFLKNSNEKTNINLIIGQRVRMLSRTDFETIGSVKINDIIWSAVDENQASIEVGDIVEIVKVQGNKLIVKKIEEEPSKDINTVENSSIENELETETKENIEKIKNKKSSNTTKKSTSKQTKKPTNAQAKKSTNSQTKKSTTNKSTTKSVDKKGGKK